MAKSAPGEPGRPAPRAVRPAERLELKPGQLVRRAVPEKLGFASTADVPPRDGTIGQDRALAALDMGIMTRAGGYNIFLVGRPGSGRRRAVLEHLRQIAGARPAPPDWVYVQNFANSDRPRLLQLSAGGARPFARQMEDLITAAGREIPRAFEGDAYQQRRQQALAGIESQRQATIEEARAFAFAHGFDLEPNPGGFVMIPIVGGKPIRMEEAQALPEAEREEIERRGSEVRDHAAGALRKLHELEREAAATIRDVDREVCLAALDPLFQPLQAQYAGSPELLAYLADLRADMPEHAGDFAAPPQEGPPGVDPAAHLDRYRVNVFVANEASDGAPVVHEANPTYYNLTGRVEYRGMFGFLSTDFRQVKAGALQRANGGFLVLEADSVLTAPFAWDALKRALKTGSVRIENLGEQLSAVPTASVQPEPMRLDLKVVVIASPAIHRLLLQVDDDLAELFKVKAELEPDVAWNRAHERRLAEFVSSVVSEHELRHFDAGAVGALLEYLARRSEDQRRLSTQVARLADTIVEASSLAGAAGRETVTAIDISEALRRRRERSNLVERRFDEAIADGTIVIRTRGRAAGQLNGLTVLDLGDYEFSRPVRITAQAGLGRGGVESIERAIELSGPIHSKGVLTLSGYLAATHAQERPLPVLATLTFEQSYSEVDGDSASSAELYALLSTLSGLPIDQGIAVTGAVNQQGEVEAVGAVSEKIEGFYRVCARAGLTGAQGVIIPRTNLRNLMLSDEVVAAVRAGRFHVWAVQRIDEGIEILTGAPAGTRGRAGRYPPGSVHGLVDQRLREFSEKLMRAAPAVPALDGQRAAAPAVVRAHPA
jgi:predicted ATP-dependent protease